MISWARIPRLSLGVLAVLAISLIGLLPVTVLDEVGVRTSPRVPWQAPLALLWMGLVWWYLNRPGWRREHLGAGGLTRRMWLLALLALLCGTGAIHALRMAVQRGLALPDVSLPDVSKYSVIVLISSFLITALAAGIFEEAGYRGYLQRILLEKYRPAVAIVLSALVFTLVHLSRGRAFYVALPFAFGFGCFYGWVAWRSGSIIPGVIVHSSYNFLRLLERWLLPPALISWAVLGGVGLGLSVVAFLAVRPLGSSSMPPAAGARRDSPGASQ